MPSPLASNSRILPAAQQACGAINRSGTRTGGNILARLARGKAPVPNAGWSGNQTGVMAGRAAVASPGAGYTATTERGPPEHPRRSVALQNTHDEVWPSRTPTTQCGPPEHRKMRPRRSVALQNHTPRAATTERGPPGCPATCAQRANIARRNTVFGGSGPSGVPDRLVRMQ